MKSLQELIQKIQVSNVLGLLDVSISGISIDSRRVQSGTMYIALKGAVADGHHFIEKAIEQGAVCIVCQVLPSAIHDNVTYIHVEDTHQVVGIIASEYYDNPSRKMKVVGVTGTNGKTTIATLLYKLFKSLGYRVGLISTVQNMIVDEIYPSTHTTPDAVSIQHLMSRMCDAGCGYVFMEVSSHAIHQCRIGGIDFDGGIFSNITHDHLDYHKTFDEYIKVKKAFFDGLKKEAFAITNIDDKRGAVMLQNTKAFKRTYSVKNIADYKGKVLENQIHGLLMNINGIDVHFRMAGLFNAYNLLAVIGAAIELGIDKQEVLSILSQVNGAEGRFEVYRSTKEHIIGIIDYAHTPDALLNVLQTIKQFDTPGRIITVVGCGGDRDTEKRPIMTTVACEHSDQVIITADNPRSESVDAILNDMTNGISAKYTRKLLRISDRKEAIRTAITLANKGDIILIAGKGHEKYQEINGIKHPFDDVDVLLKQWNELEK